MAQHLIGTAEESSHQFLANFYNVVTVGPRLDQQGKCLPHTVQLSQEILVTRTK